MASQRNWIVKLSISTQCEPTKNPLLCTVSAPGNDRGSALPPTSHMLPSLLPLMCSMQGWRKKLPETIFGKTGAGIVSVTNIDGTAEYTYATPNAIINKAKRQYGNKVNQKFYYIRDGYLYLPNAETELVNITIFALDTSEVEDVSECSTCEECNSKWDNEFVCPDRFIDLVLRETVQEIASIYRTSIADENPNLDENIKSQTTK